MSGSGTGRAFAAEPIVTAGAPLPEAWQNQLVRCEVDENVGLPDAATITFRDGNHEFLTATRITIGTPLEIAVTTSENQARESLFAGEVTALELDSDSTGSFTIVRAHSLAHRLLRGRKVVAFRNKTLPSIVKEVISGSGISVGRIDAPRIVYRQLSQPGVSDWEFLQYLAAENGAIVRVDEKGTLDFVRPAQAAKAPPPGVSAEQSPFVLEYGDNLMALRAVLTGADEVDAVEVRGWNPDTKKAVVANQRLEPSRTVRPGLKSPNATGKATMLVTDTPYGNNAEARAAARSLAESMSAGLAEFEAVVDGNPLLHADRPVTLSKVGDQFSGRYTATAVTHTLDPDSGYRTTVLVSASRDRSLAGLVTGGNAPAHKPRMPGLAIGEVTNVRETDGRQRGWVKLKFPWLDDTYQTDWVRTVQLGGQTGVFSPDVGDEVLVGFEQGDLDRPYVLGGLYNGKDLPARHKLPLIDNTGKVSRRSLVSSNGNRLELIDGMAGPPGVRIASGDERVEVRVNDLRNQIDLTVFAAGGTTPLSSISLTPTGIDIDAGKGKLRLHGASVEIDGDTSASIDGGATARLRGHRVWIN